MVTLEDTISLSPLPSVAKMPSHGVLAKLNLMPWLAAIASKISLEKPTT